MKGYGWEEHDGRSFGRQTITDNAKDGGLTATLVTSFAKPAGAAEVAWASRVALELGRDPSTPGKKRPSPVSLYFYLGVDCDGELEPGACAEAATLGSGLAVERGEGGTLWVRGQTAELGAFSLELAAWAADAAEAPRVSYWGGAGVLLADIQKRVGGQLKKASGLSKAKLKNKEKMAPADRRTLAAAALPDTVAAGANVVVVKLTCPDGCMLDAVLHPHPAGPPTPATAASAVEVSTPLREHTSHAVQRWRAKQLNSEQLNPGLAKLVTSICWRETAV